MLALFAWEVKEQLFYYPFPGLWRENFFLSFYSNHEFHQFADKYFVFL